MKTVKDDKEDNGVRYSVQLWTTDFGFLFYIEKLDEMYDEFFKRLNSVLEEKYPTRKVRISKNKPPYLTFAWKALCKKKQRLQRKKKLFEN